MDQHLTYEAAYKELAQISREIESESVTVDVLAQKVKRAAELVALCQAKLKLAESEVGKIIAQMEGAKPGSSV